MKAIKNPLYFILGILVLISMVSCEPKALTAEDVLVSSDEQLTQELAKENPNGYTIYNINDLLDDLIRQADELVGKPVALMTKDDKVKAIQYLNSSGALLITKSGDKIAKHFGISKYTLYSYLDNSKTGG